MAWFRVYDTLIDNPKVMRLKPELFRALISLWCLAKRCGGKLPSISDIAFAMRVAEAKVTTWLGELKDANLIDETAEGIFMPHDWNAHQYASDNVTARVQKHRAKHNGHVPGNVTPPLQETHQNRSRDRTEAETEQKVSKTLLGPNGPADSDDLEIPVLLDRSAAAVALKLEFETWWAIYPRKQDKGHALKAYAKARKSVSAAGLLAGVDRYAAERNGQEAQFTKLGATWLNGLCWLDETADQAASRQREEFRKAIEDQETHADQ